MAVALKFDEVRVDTKLAEEYLQKEKKQFHSKGFKDQGPAGYDACKNLVFYADYINISEIPKKLFDLAKNIKQNVDLFCQLEYMIRKIPINDTKNVDLKLLIQNLLHYSTLDTKLTRISSGGFMWRILVDGQSSLAALGCVAQGLMSGLSGVDIECTADTAAVCCLFTDLCYRVGLQEKVRLAILSETPEYGGNVTVNFREIHELKNGCVSIVTVKSDVDSAVGAILATTDRYPWHIKRILVQESALEHFKNTLEWKTKCSRDTTEECADERFKDLCTAVYRHKGKTFLYEFTGTKIDDDSSNFITIESYRTTKELLSLLKDSNHFAASLWSADVAESNQIAATINSNIIWINDFCNFHGPPKASRAFYDTVASHFKKDYVEERPEIVEAMQLRESWLKIDANEREVIVKDILKAAPQPKTNITVSSKDSNSELDSFASIENNALCFGTEVVPLIMKWIDPLDLHTIAFVVKGGGLIIHTKHANDFTMHVYEALRAKGAPIVGHTDDFRLGNVRILNQPFYNMKVIWSHFGTTFAN